MADLISRRQMLKWTAVGSAAAMLSACAPKEVVVEKEVTRVVEKEVEKVVKEAVEVEKEVTRVVEKVVPSEDAVVINQWYHVYAEEGCQAAVYRIADEFNQMQNKIEVRVGWFPGSYSTKLNAAFAAGDAPDCYETHIEIDHIRTKAVLCLDELLTQEDVDAYSPGVLEANGMMKGKTYSLPMILDPRGIYVRDSMLAEAGIENDPDNWTWEKLFEAGKTLTSGRVKGMFLGNDAGESYMAKYYSRNTGLDVLKPDTLEFDFVDEKMFAAWNTYQEMREMNILLMGAPNDAGQPDALISGMTGIQRSGMWIMPAVIDALGDDFSFCLFPPAETGGDTARYWCDVRAWQAAIWGKTEHVAEAAEFTKWLWIDNTDWQNEWATAYGFHMPCTAAALEANEELKVRQGAKAVEQMNKYASAVSNLWGGTVDDPFNEAISSIVKESADPEEAITAALPESEKELALAMQYYDELPG